MAAEEINKPDTKAGEGEFANLIGNVGILLDSTIESVQGMINSVSSVTGQLIEGVNSTIKSEPLQEIIQNVNSVSGQLIEGVNSVSGQLFEGVNATINSQQVQEFGKMLKNLLDNLNTTVSSGQVQNLFSNVSFGLGQLVNTVFSPVIGSGHDEHQKKEVKQIPFCGHAPEPKPQASAAPPAPPSAPENPAEN
ncbi:MAG: chlorosome envelope protein H [Chlorobiaceae bacterium]|nr:chlorosome envelope protein H [Chlorobiaceae bacterium]